MLILLLLRNLVGTSVFEQNLIDQMMIDLDGTANKSNLGANAILGVSLLLQKQLQMNWDCHCIDVGGVSANTLPVPMMNIINGVLILMRQLLSRIYDFPVRRLLFLMHANGYGDFHSLKSFTR
jgi:enolase